MTSHGQRRPRYTADWQIWSVVIAGNEGLVEELKGDDASLPDAPYVYYSAVQTDLNQEDIICLTKQE